jgi:hypothetical protein
MSTVVTCKICLCVFFKSSRKDRVVQLKAEWLKEIFSKVFKSDFIFSRDTGTTVVK